MTLGETICKVKNRRPNSGSPPAASFFVIHWDGKLLFNLTGPATIDRLPVLIPGVNTQQLLSVPKFYRSTVAEQDKIQILRQCGFHKNQKKNGS